MKKRFFSWILAFALTIALLPILPQRAEAAGDNAVTVYLSVSDDANFVKMGSKHVMAFKKMTVPYFDLEYYGLEQYYFVSETYGRGDDTEENANAQIQKPSSDLSPGTAKFAYGKVTMLHALIYATEVYYLGVKPENAGQGELVKMGKLGEDSDVLYPTGSVGSMYLKKLWGMDENLNYYHNYAYPLASPGWGSTADQILLEDGDIITVGHFDDWGFHQDPLCVFNLISPADSVGTEDIPRTMEVAQGESAALTVLLAGKGEDYATAHTPRTENLPVYSIPLSELDNGNVTKWDFRGQADDQGNITIDTTAMAPGEYLVCVPGQTGKNLTDVIVSAPGGILLTVTESVMLGDVNGDDTVDGRDVVRLRQYTVDPSENTIVESNADVTGDGTVDGRDVVRLRKYTVDKDGVVLG